MNAVVVLGAGCGAGLFLVGRGLAGGPVSLVGAVRRLDRDGTSVHALREAGAPDHPGVAGSLLALCGERLAGRLGGRVEADLAAVDRSPQRFAIEKLTLAVTLGAIAMAFAALLAVGGSPLGGGFVAVLVAVAIAVGFVAPDVSLRQQAARRRNAFRHALSSYLDLVNVLLAGGAGLETALDAAAVAGDSWSFAQIRNALVRAQTLRRPTFDCLSDLGERIGVAELRELAASVRLAGEQGARIKLSLAAKAAALRAQQMAHVEAEANAATERMGLPTVLMFLAFIVLLGYPATRQIAGAL